MELTIGVSMNKRTSLSPDLVAACGMNCGICIAFMRDKKPCPGCHGDNTQKPSHCVHCKIVECAYIKNTSTGLCVDCVKFPCARINQLDKRYRTNYGMSMIENLLTIKTHGMDTFLAQEQIRWTCIHCGGAICIHRGECMECGKAQFT
jgi:hypothetical protein